MAYPFWARGAYRDLRMLRCATCDGAPSTVRVSVPVAARSSKLGRTVLALVLAFDPALVPLHPWLRAEEEWYEEQVHQLLRLHSSLLAVNCSLPVYIILSGWQNQTVVRTLRALRGDVTIVRMGSVVPPPLHDQAGGWARQWYRGTFAKLLVLNLTLALRARALYVDNDMVCAHVVSL